MPRIKEDTTRPFTFRVSERLYEQFREAVEAEERTPSAAMRLLMREKVRQGDQRKAA